MRLVSKYLILASAILGLAMVIAGPVLAQVSQGDFVEYSISHKSNLDSPADGNGVVKLEVIDQYDNGTLKIGFSGIMNDFEFELKKIVGEDSYTFPRFISPPEIEQTISRDNGSVAVTLERLPDEEFSFQESNWVMNISRISIEVRGPMEERFNVDGIVRIFSISGILQSFAGRIHSVEQDLDKTIAVDLIDTNLDLSVRPKSSLTVLSQINALSSLGLVDPSISNGPLIIQGAPSTSNLPPYSLILALVIGIILISFVSIRARNSNMNSVEEENKPLHWVN